ncbi:MAG: EAL domain-containing protein, partial [Herbaspirillum sp.]
LYAEPGRVRHQASPLLTLAATRGKLLELIAEKTQPKQRHVADVAFTVGIMSLMDTLFGAPMVEILKEISVAEAVSDALLEGKGVYGDMLRLCESLERIDEADALILPLVRKLGLSIDELYQLELRAFEWVNSISQVMY